MLVGFQKSMLFFFFFKSTFWFIFILCVGTDTPLCACGQRTTCRNWLCPSTIWVLGIQLQLSGLVEVPSWCSLPCFYESLVLLFYHVLSINQLYDASLSSDKKYICVLCPENHHIRKSKWLSFFDDQLSDLMPPRKRCLLKHTWHQESPLAVGLW